MRVFDQTWESVNADESLPAFMQRFNDRNVIRLNETLPQSPNLRPWTWVDRLSLINFYEEIIDQTQIVPIFFRGGNWSTSRELNRVLEDGAPVGSLESRTILDLGCGFCPLLNYLEFHFPSYQYYWGVDAHTFIEKPYLDYIHRNRFTKRDPFDSSFWQALPFQNKKFDFIFALGLFDVRPKDWTPAEFNRIMIETIKIYYSLVKRGMVISFVPSFPITPSEISSHVDPHQVNRMQLVNTLSQTLGCQVDSAQGDDFQLQRHTTFFLYPNQRKLRKERDKQ